MKKLLTILSIILSCSLSAQVVINMEQEGGVYKIPCKINGAKLKMIFDSGAANVCLSESIVEYLLDNDYITKEDFKGVGSSSVADGRIVDHLRINIRDLEIEGLHLRNVEGVVIVGQKGSLLLGQSAIQSLGLVTINGNQLIIHNGYTQLSDEEISTIRNTAENYLDSKYYRAAIKEYEKLEKCGVADYYDIYSLAFALQMSDQYEKSGPVIERWFDQYEQYSTPRIQYLMYDLYASYFRFRDRPNYNKAISYLYKMKNMLTKLYGYETADYYNRDYQICRSLGECYFHLESYSSASKYFRQAAASYSAPRYTIDMFERGVVHDEKLGYCWYMYALCQTSPEYIDSAMIMAAKFGDKEAQNYCGNLGLRWH